MIIDGLTVDVSGKMFSESTGEWIPAGMFELKPEGCTVNIQATNTTFNIPSHGVINARGVITIDGKFIR